MRCSYRVCQCRFDGQDRAPISVWMSWTGWEMHLKAFFFRGREGTFDDPIHELRFWPQVLYTVLDHEEMRKWSRRLT